MTSAETIDIGRDAIFVTLRVGGPVMLIALVVGLAVSLFQALTQLQEMTLSYVPKMVAIMAALVMLFPYMLRTLTTFTEKLFDHIVQG